MHRQTQRKLILISQILTMVGVGVAALWHSASLWVNLPDVGYGSLLAPFPGVLCWGLAQMAPRLVMLAPRPMEASYRLVYSSPESWSDTLARQALLNLAQTLNGLTIIWARDGQGIGCWLIVPAHDAVLQRLVAETFPNGQLEVDQPPAISSGVTLLALKETLPNPDQLCLQEGIDGVYYRWQSTEAAVISIWGPQAGIVSQTYARRDDLLIETGIALQRPPWLGQNLWPQLPPFPPSTAHPGLAAMSQLSLTASDLRVAQPALTLGEDAEGHAAGFALPTLAKAEVVQVLGQHTVQVVSDLVYQAIREEMAVFLFDGEGSLMAQTSKHLGRELATEQILTCDLDRPAQSRFRLNPFWLPDDVQAWPEVTTLWRQWLRSLGVTVGGLGQTAYRHTHLAVMLTALAAYERDLTMDPKGLREALAQPDFLTQVETEFAEGLFDPVTWQWWHDEGRLAPRFDVQQRLGHLRERLARLLTIPQYQVLWQAPYLDLPACFAQKQSLFWRFPDRATPFQPFMQGQLLALINALNCASDLSPVFIVLHQFEGADWLEPLTRCSAVRMITTQPHLPHPMKPTTRVISRLDRETAAQMTLPDIRNTTLRRLPPGQLIIQQGEIIGTVRMEAFS